MRAAERVAAVAPWLRRHPGLTAFLLGALQSQAFAPRSIWPLGILCLAGLFWLWLGATPGRAARTAFAFAAGLFFAGTYWLYMSIHVFGQAPIVLALILMAGLVVIMATQAAAWAWLLAKIRPAADLPTLLAVYPAGWVLMEWMRGWFLSGFPWLALGYSGLDTWIVGLAPVVGIYGVSLAAAVTAGALIAYVRANRRTRLVLEIGVPLLWAVGALLTRVEWTRPTGAPVGVAIVQGAISQDLKWQEQNRDHTLEVYRSMTLSALGTPIIVWPEAALPMVFNDAIPYLKSIYVAAREKHSDLVLGLLHVDPETQQYKNGIIALGDDAEWYDKRRLVPFGEFFPVPPFVRSWMRLRNLTYVDLAPGEEGQGPLDAAGQKLGATICYEDAYAVEQLAVLKTATLLVNVTNDAWFGDSSAPHQHMQIARMRAIEAGRWLIRATNNGVSAFIDPHGHIVKASRQFVPEVLRGEVVPYTGLTPYAIVRNWPVLGACVALVAVFAWRGRRRRGGEGRR